MTNLNTILPLEVVKSNKKLQKIDIENTRNSDKEVFRNETEVTIADIINNAEMLFGNMPGQFYIFASNKILRMCQQDKSIKEISDYIIKNIKE